MPHTDFTASRHDELTYESPYLRRARRDAPRQRLFCFPHAGAGATAYASWAALLPAEIELIAIQLPGREDRLGEPPLIEANRLVRQVVQVMRPYLGLPFSFFGHSGGALFAFELARAMHIRGREPAHLFVSGQPAPELTYQLPVLHTLPDTELVAAVRDLGGTAGAVTDDPQLLDVLLPALRADFTMWERYRYEPGPALTAPITAFGGDRDDRAPLSVLRPWAHHTDGAFTIRLLKGNHFFLHDRMDELVGEISAALR